MAQYFNNMTTILYVLNTDSGRKVFTSTKLNLDLNLYSSKNGSLSVKHTTKFINNNTLKEGGHIMLLYVYKSVLRLCTLLHLNATVVAMQPKKFLNRARYFFTGLGYKVYTRKNTLFVWVGLTHYTCIDFPQSIFIFAKKRRMYIISFEAGTFRALLQAITRIKKRDIYKGKGLLEVKSYKNFIKMKTGKKKQY